MTNFLDVKLGEIADNRYRLRKVVMGVEELAEDIQRRGLINPITVREVQDLAGAKYEVAQGDRRLAAYRLLKKKTIKAQVEEFESESDFLSFSIAENVKRRNLTWLELGEALLELRELHDYREVIDKATHKDKVGWEEVSKITGLSYSHVQQTAGTVARLEPETRDRIYMAREQVTREGAYEIISWNDVQFILADIKDDEQANKIIVTVVDFITRQKLGFRDALIMAKAELSVVEVEKLVEVADEYELDLTDIAECAAQVGSAKAVQVVDRAVKYKEDYREKPDVGLWTEIEKAEDPSLAKVKRQVEAIEERRPTGLTKQEVRELVSYNPLTADETVRMFLDMSQMYNDTDGTYFNMFFEYEEWRRRNEDRIRGKLGA
jgi:ParB/RepB/Spo0J family partition protein